MLELGMRRTCSAGTGGLWCWGQNQHGQLGIGNNVDKMYPTAVPLPLGVSSVLSLSVGIHNTCIIGDNQNLTVGVTTRKDSLVLETMLIEIFLHWSQCLLLHCRWLLVVLTVVPWMSTSSFTMGERVTTARLVPEFRGLLDTPSHVTL